MKAIETFYKGYRFRSRLEARWAVFFDALGIKWEYEPEGYDLGEAGWYLPDFWLPEYSAFIEVKAVDPTEEERRKMHALITGFANEQDFRHGYFAIGIPDAESVNFTVGSCASEAGIFDAPLGGAAALCSSAINKWGVGTFFYSGGYTEYYDEDDAPLYAKAKSARFGKNGRG